MKKLIVLGAGESGVGTALLGKQKGYNVFVSDKGIIAKKYKKVLQQNKILFEEEQHTEAIIFKADIVVKSPGIPDRIAVLQELRNKGIPIISEIEFASVYTKATMIGITGSNGKTTTTLLTHYLLRKAGIHVGAAGNIGDSFAQQVVAQHYDVYVLELSSFQLDGIHKFNPHIAILTNITPDHLDRYDYNFDNYIASKFRITKNQTAHDFLIYDGDDEIINTWLKNNQTKATLVPFSLQREVEYGAFIRKNTMIIKLNSEEVLMNVSNLKLQGKHNTKKCYGSGYGGKVTKGKKKKYSRKFIRF